MKIGVFATFMSPLATPQMVGELGRRLEAAGLESLWMGEHVVLFDQMEFPYPGSRDGRIPVPEGVLLSCSADLLAPLPFPFPAFLKPVANDASHGIAACNLVSDEASFRARAGELLKLFPGRVLAESRLPAEVIEQLRQRGHEVVLSPEYAHGKVMGIRFDRERGLIHGAVSAKGIVGYAFGY